METKFKSLSIFEFQTKFPDNQSCYTYLANLKWKEGYKCPQCQNEKYCNGSTKHDRQCTKCSYVESPTAGTLFHMVKFSILKAFWIVYYLSTGKKGMSSTELSRKLQLRQKTCWLFKHKVMQAMESRNLHPLEGSVEVGLFEINNKEKIEGKKRNRKAKVVIGIEKKTKGISRMYACHLIESSAHAISEFINTKISKEVGLNAKDINKATSKQYDKMQRAIHGFKAWFAGIHGHAKYLQYYINEYCYRFNRHLMKEEIFDDLLGRMVKHKPAPYLMIIDYVPNS